MNITINTKTLINAFSEVSPFIPQKSPIMVLKYAKITTKGNRIKIEANDTQCSIRKYVQATNIDQDSSFLVDIVDINSYLKKCKHDETTIVVQNDTMTIKNGDGYAEYQILNANEYPDFSMPTDDSIDIALSNKTLNKCIKIAKNFAGTDDLRPTMKCIYAYIKDNKFGYCATDTRKMITSEEACNDVDGIDVSWYVVPAIFASLENHCKDFEIVSIKVNPTHVSYHFGDIIIQTTQPQGQYPSFKRVIPQQWALCCCVDKNVMVDALNRAELLCDVSRLTKIEISPLDMIISANDFAKLKKSSEHIQHNGCNGDITIGLHVDHLKTCISACTSDEIELRMTDASRPVLFHHSDDESMTIVLMPMTLI